MCNPYAAPVAVIAGMLAVKKTSVGSIKTSLPENIGRIK